MDLTQRQKVIFKTLVDEFIRTAEPVGSKSLIPLLDFPVSSATVRAEMAVLEKVGLLEKTHTSSGRVPSNRGYLYYVEHLMETALDPQTEQSLKELYKQRHACLEDVISASCSILSEMTHLTSVVIGPKEDSQRLLKLALVPLDDTSAAALFVTSSGHTENKIFTFPQSVSIADLTECTSILNENLAGTPIGEVVEKMEQLRSLMAARITRYEVLFEAFVSAFMSMGPSSPEVFGRANMLAQPEFSDLSRLRRMMEILDSQSLLRQWRSGPDNITVPIGQRNELMQIGECSVVSTKFEIPTGEQGQLMVIGPNRMPYQQVASLMDFMSRQIESLFFQPEGGLQNEQQQEEYEKRKE